MSKNVIIGVLLLVIGILIGMNLPALSAQQREGRAARAAAADDGTVAAGSGDAAAARSRRIRRS